MNLSTLTAFTKGAPSSAHSLSNFYSSPIYQTQILRPKLILPLTDTGFCVNKNPEDHFSKVTRQMIRTRVSSILRFYATSPSALAANHVTAVLARHDITSISEIKAASTLQGLQERQETITLRAGTSQLWYSD